LGRLSAAYGQSKSTVRSSRKLMQVGTAPEQVIEWAHSPIMAKQILRIFINVIFFYTIWQF